MTVLKPKKHLFTYGQRPLRIPTAWYQIGGDVDAKAHGIVIARMTKGGAEPQIEIVQAIPFDAGPRYYRYDVDIPVSDLGWEDNKDAARTSGLSKRDWEDGEGFTANAFRALARYDHWGATHLGGTVRTVQRFSDALPVRLSSVKQFQR
jgi:hypothetical protein